MPSIWQRKNLVTARNKYESYLPGHNSAATPWSTTRAWFEVGEAKTEPCLQVSWQHCCVTPQDKDMVGVSQATQRLGFGKRSSETDEETLKLGGLQDLGIAFVGQKLEFLFFNPTPHPLLPLADGFNIPTLALHEVVWCATVLRRRLVTDMCVTTTRSSYSTTRTEDIWVSVSLPPSQPRFQTCADGGGQT